MSPTSLFGSLLRSLLTLAGTFLIGHSVFGHVLMSATWDTITGIVLTAGSVYWSLYNGTATEENLESMARQLLQGIGGFLVGSGVLNSSQLTQIISFVILALPMLWGYLSKSKTAKIAAGKLTAQSTGQVKQAAPPPGPINNANIGSKLTLLLLLLGISMIAHAQFEWTGPFSTVKKSGFNSHALIATAAPKATTLNTLKVNVSLPGYYYSNGKQQSAVVGLGYCFEHYVNDSLLYSIGPYIWYNSPVPTGSTQLPIGYGAAGSYKGLFLVGIMTPDLVHWGPVISLDFSFGNGGISFGGFNL